MLEQDHQQDMYVCVPGQIVWVPVSIGYLVWWRQAQTGRELKRYWWHASGDDSRAIVFSSLVVDCEPPVSIRDRFHYDGGLLPSSFSQAEHDSWRAIGSH